MGNFVKAHQKSMVVYVVALAFTIYYLLDALDTQGGVWSFFSSTPPYEWLTERWPGMTYETYWWIRIAIYCVGLITIIWMIRQQRREEKEYESLQSTVARLQKELATAESKLAAIEDERPLLKTEPYSIQRKTGHHYYSGPHSPRDIIGEFALLRVTNEPTTLNSNAIAYQIYSKVSYCDEHWKELFRSVEGAWFSLWQSPGPSTIGPPKHKPDSLDPHTSTYLGIGLRYQKSEAALHALSASSGNFPNWFDPDLALARETTYIKVTLGCHGFQEDYYFLLKNCGTERRLLLEPTTPPPPSSEDASHFSSKNEPT